MQGLDLSFFLEKDTFLVFGALLLIALTALFSERAGIINIALEGQLVAGVFGYTFVGFLTSDWNFTDVHAVRLLLSILGAFVLILMVTLIFAFFTVTIRLNQILVGISLNIILTAAAAFFILLFKGGSIFVSQSDYVSIFNQFQKFSYVVVPYQAQADTTSFIEIFIPLFILLATLPIIYLFLFRTTAGLRIRSCGENPSVVKLVGISVSTYRYLALLIGACLMVGASVMFVETKSSFGGNVAGFGYLGLVMLILGNRNIILILIFTFIFSIFYRLSISLNDLIFTKEVWKEKTQAMKNFGREIFSSINYLLPLFCLLIYGLIRKKKTHSNVPESLGK